MFKLLALCLIVLSLNTMDMFAQETVKVMVLDWSPDGTWIATGHPTGEINIWDVQSGTVFNTLHGHTQEIMTMKWSPDGTRIASGSPDGSVRIWDVKSGESTHIIQFSQPQGGFRAILDIAWSFDGRLIAGARETGLIIIWDADTGEHVSSYTHDGMALTVEWHPSGTLLASGGLDGKVLLWDMSSQTLSEFSPFSAENVGPIYSIAWSPDGDQIAIGLGRVRVGVHLAVFNFSDQELVYQLPEISDGLVAIRWSPAGDELAIRDLESIRIVDSLTGALVTSHDANGVVDSMAWSPFGGRLALTHTDHQSLQILGDDVVQIIVPDPSLERLQAIAAACNAPATIEQSLTASIEADRLTEFVAQVESLPAEAIPPACRADLLAVAQALASR